MKTSSIRESVAVRSRLRESYFAVRNRLSRAPATGRANCVVCLTSYGDRVNSVHVAIESIARGDVRPRRIILYLSEQHTSTQLPHQLDRLRKRGVEIRYTKDYLSHKKYYPYAISSVHHEFPLVTADDDTIYPREWLAQIYRIHESDPDSVIAQRARKITFDERGTLAPYSNWPLQTDIRQHPTTFPTGVSGVLYPPAVLDALRDAGEGFMNLVPYADDPWLHLVSLRAGHPARQVSPIAQDYPAIRGTQHNALVRRNAWAAENDAHFSALYTKSDLQLMVKGLRNSD